ncbi:MAG: hypothetical protein BV458_13930 [Thermoplasmata archaeon M9B2D]|nr:MAG: hypothetical protein BV458_13930 [Thermoplasmata archaeon M9B2D]
MVLLTRQESVSIKKAIDDLLQTHIFKELSKANDPEFTKQLALWLVRYILVLASMKNSFKISFEETLSNLHGDRYRKIIEITEKTFSNKDDQTENDTPYIR